MSRYRTTVDILGEIYAVDRKIWNLFVIGGDWSLTGFRKVRGFQMAVGMARKSEAMHP